MKHLSLNRGSLLEGMANLLQTAYLSVIISSDFRVLDLKISARTSLIQSDGASETIQRRMRETTQREVD